MLRGPIRQFFVMKEFIEYQAIAGGKVRICEPSDLSEGKEQGLLGVSAMGQGQYQVKAIGALPDLDSVLLLPVKGATQLSLRFTIESIEPLIQPPNSWMATCQGPNIQAFNVREAQITCDACFTEYRLEFIEESKDPAQDAIFAMNQQGWMASTEAQVCPSCQSKAGQNEN